MAAAAQGAGHLVEVVVGDRVDHERRHGLALAGRPALGERAVGVGRQVHGGRDLAVGELLGEHLAQVGLVHGGGGMPRHHRVPVEAVDLAGEHPEVVAEGGVAAELRLGGGDGDRPEPGELLVQQLDASTDAAQGGQAVEGRADLVEQHLGAGPRDLGELGADQFVEGFPAE